MTRNMIKIAILAATAALFPVVATLAQSTTNPPATASSTLIDINSATLQQLETLPGISSKIADEIIKNRPFKDVNDLASRVNGIGKKSVKKLEPLISFGSAPASTTANPPAVAAGTVGTAAAGTATVAATTPKTRNTPSANLGKGIAPNPDGSCPTSAPVKGSKKGIYHLPTGDSNYARTKAKACFATPDDAKAAGYRAVGGK